MHDFLLSHSRIDYFNQYNLSSGSRTSILSVSSRIPRKGNVAAGPSTFCDTGTPMSQVPSGGLVHTDEWQQPRRTNSRPDNVGHVQLHFFPMIHISPSARAVNNFGADCCVNVPLHAEKVSVVWQSNLASWVPLPRRTMVATASSIDAYDNEHTSREIPSFTLDPLG